VTCLPNRLNRFMLELLINKSVQNKELSPSKGIGLGLKDGAKILNRLAAAMPGEQIITNNATQADRKRI
jgi:hypothetical protein